MSSLHFDQKQNKKYLDSAVLTLEQKLDFLVQYEEEFYECMEETFIEDEKIKFPFLDSRVIR